MATILIFVKGFTGKTFGLHVQPDSTVDSVKLLVEQATGVKPDVQRLIIGGRQLEDGQRLCDCHVKNEATLHLVARLRGMISSFTESDVGQAAVAYLMLDDDDRARAATPVEELRRIAVTHNANPSESFALDWPSPLTPDEMAHLCKFLQSVWDDASSNARAKVGSSNTRAKAVEIASTSDKADETSAAASSRSAVVRGSAGSNAAVGGGAGSNASGRAAVGESAGSNAAVGETAGSNAAVAGGAGSNAAVGESAVGNAAVGDLKVVVSQKQLVEILLAMHKRAAADDEDTDVMARAMATTQDLLALFKGPPHARAKIAFRMTVGPTNACIPFHCDGPYATSTTQIALNSSKEYQGGRLVYCTFEGTFEGAFEDAFEGAFQGAFEGAKVESARVRLHVTERPAGTVTHHRPKIVHGVTRMVSGTRYSLFVLDDANGLGDKDVLDLARDSHNFSRIMSFFCRRQGRGAVAAISVAGTDVAGRGAVSGISVAGTDVAGGGMAGSGITGSGITGTDVAGSGIKGSGFAGCGIAGSGICTSYLMEFDESPDKKARRFGR